MREMVCWGFTYKKVETQYKNVFLYPQKFYFTEYKIFPVPILVHLLKVLPLVLKK
jgi:hypothetical protein